MEPCPPLATLKRLLEDSLPESADPFVDQHLENCSQCQQTLQELLAGDADYAVNALSRVLPRAHRVDDKISDAELVRRLEDISPFFRWTSENSGEERAPVPVAVPISAIGSPAHLPTVAGYEILGVLGSGGMGIVYKARQQRLNRLVALKMIAASAQERPDWQVRFHAEAEAIARLEHPNIVRVYDIGEQDGKSYIALELVESGSLSTALAGAPQSVEAAAKLAETLARAMHFAHQRGIIHRDLKPANVLLAGIRGQESGVRSRGAGSRGQEAEVRGQGAGVRADEASMVPPTPDPCLLPPGLTPDPCLLTPGLTPSLTPKITDFGLAKRLDDDSGLTQSGSIVGTPSYMAPEQAAGHNAAVGPASDIYALGAILYEMLTGRPPFRGPSAVDTLMLVRIAEPVPPTRMQPKIPRDLETICLKCLHKDARRRFTDAEALADDLNRFLNGRPILARPTPQWERGLKWARQNPTVAALSLGIVVITLLGIGLVTWQWQRASDKAIAESVARGEAETLKRQADEQRKRAEWFLASLAVERSLNLCEQGNVSRGVLELARNLEAISLPPEYERVVRANLAIWGRAFPYLHNTLMHDRVRALAFSPDGRLLVSAGDDNAARLWDVGTGQISLRPMPHPSSITLAGFRPDGQAFFTAGSDAVVRLWSSRTGELLGTPMTHQGIIVSAAFTADSSTFITGTTEGVVTLWEAATGKRLRSFRQPAEHATVALSLDGKLALISTWRGDACIWDTAKATIIGSPIPQLTSTRLAAFSSDGQHFATVGTDSAAPASTEKMVQLWKTSTHTPVGAPLVHPREVTHVSFSPDGQRLVTYDQDQQLRLWDVLTGQLAGPPLPQSSPLMAIAFSPDEQMLATGDENGVYVWKMQSFQPLALDPTATSPVVCYDLSRDNTTLATASRNRVVRLWNIANHEPIGQPLPHSDVVEDIAFSPDGELLLTGCQDKSAYLWNWRTAQRVAAFALPDKIHHVQFSPDGRFILTGSRKIGKNWKSALDKIAGASLPIDRSRLNSSAIPGDESTTAGELPQSSVQLWNAATQQPIGHWLPHMTVRGSARFSPDSKTVATVDEERKVQCWDSATGRARGHALIHPDRIEAIAFSPDSALLLTGCRDGSARLWDVDTSSQFGEPMRHRLGVIAVAFHPLGQVILTGSDDKTAQLWDANTCERLDRTLPHAEPVQHVAFDEDGKTILTRAKDRLVRLWDLATGKLIGPALSHDPFGCPIRWSLDGGTVVTRSRAGSAQIWNVPAPMHGDASSLVLWTQIQTGMELDSSGAVRWLTAKEWQARRR